MCENWKPLYENKQSPIENAKLTYENKSPFENRNHQSRKREIKFNTNVFSSSVDIYIHERSAQDSYLQSEHKFRERVKGLKDFVSLFKSIILKGSDFHNPGQMHLLSSSRFNT